MKNGQPSALHNALSSLFDLVVLNLLWIICSLPIITMGASTVALYSATLPLVRSEGSSFRDFFSAFKNHFKRATLLWLLVLAGAGIIATDFYIIARYWNIPFRVVILGILALCALLLALTYAFLFPLVSESNTKPLRTFSSAFVLGLRYLPRSFTMTLLNILPLALALFWPYTFLITLVLWVIIGFSLIAYLNSMMLKGVMQKLKAEQ